MLALSANSVTARYRSCRSSTVVTLLGAVIIWAGVWSATASRMILEKHRPLPTARCATT